MMVVYPTHTCFDDAGSLLRELLDQHEGYRQTLTLVHGICAGPQGHLWVHAWLEEGEVVYFAGLVEGERVRIEATRSEFYQVVQVKECTRYTVDHALRLSRRSGHCGPWHPRYKALCQTLQETRG